MAGSITTPFVRLANSTAGRLISLVAGAAVLAGCGSHPPVAPVYPTRSTAWAAAPTSQQDEPAAGGPDHPDITRTPIPTPDPGPQPPPLQLPSNAQMLELTMAGIIQFADGTSSDFTGILLIGPGVDVRRRLGVSAEGATRCEQAVIPTTLSGVSTTRVDMGFLRWDNADNGTRVMYSTMSKGGDHFGPNTFTLPERAPFAVRLALTFYDSDRGYGHTAPDFRVQGADGLVYEARDDHYALWEPTGRETCDTDGGVPASAAPVTPDGGIYTGK